MEKSLGTVGHSFVDLGNTRKSTKKVRSRAWFFTYNNPGDIFVAQLGDIFLGRGIKDYVFQKEKGKTIHLQGVIRYENPKENWPDMGKNFHWERCRSWKAAIKYCSKLDTRVEGPWTNLNNLNYRKTIIDPLKDVELYGWQKNIKKMLRTDAGQRQVYWYWDEEGNCGKTTLAKHLKILYDKKLLYLNGMSRDVLFALAKRIDDGIDVDIVIFGLSRQDKNGCSYKSIEIIKDGLGFSGKYESCEILMNNVHVVVFANFEPEYKKLSNDRWIVEHVRRDTRPTDKGLVPRPRDNNDEGLRPIMNKIDL